MRKHLVPSSVYYDNLLFQENKQRTKHESVLSHQHQQQRPQNNDPMDHSGIKMHEVEFQKQRPEFQESNQFKKLTSTPVLQRHTDTMTGGSSNARPTTSKECDDTGYKRSDIPIPPTPPVETSNVEHVPREENFTHITHEFSSELSTATDALSEGQRISCSTKFEYETHILPGELSVLWCAKSTFTLRTVPEKPSVSLLSKSLSTTDIIPEEPSVSLSTKSMSTTDIIPEEPSLSFSTKSTSTTDEPGIPHRDTTLIESELDSKSHIFRHTDRSPCPVTDKPDSSIESREPVYGTQVGEETEARITKDTQPTDQQEVRSTVGLSQSLDETTFSHSPPFPNFDGSFNCDETREFDYSGHYGRQDDFAGIGRSLRGVSRTSDKTTSSSERETIEDDPLLLSSNERQTDCEQITEEVPPSLSLTSRSTPNISHATGIFSKVKLFDLTENALVGQNECEIMQKEIPLSGWAVLANNGQVSTSSNETNVRDVLPNDGSRCSDFREGDEFRRLDQSIMESPDESNSEAFAWPTSELSEQRLTSESTSQNLPAYHENDEQRPTPRHRTDESGCSSSHLNTTDNSSDKNWDTTSQTEENPEGNFESTGEDVNLPRVLWAVTKISIFQDGTRTYKVMEPSDERPSQIPEKTDCLFVLVPKKD
jgi:hypothetical protein